MRSTISLLLFLAIFGSLSARIVHKRSKHVRFPRRLQTSASDSGVSGSNSTSSPANSTNAADNSTSGVAGGAQGSAKNDTSDDLEAPGIGSCKPELLKAFGLSGLATPIKVTIDMCPSITDSCCSLADQKVIFKNWDTNQEGANLDKKFANYTETLNQFFEVASRVSKLANDLVSPVSISKPNECGLMARRILTYQIEDSSAVLNDMFARSYSFMATSHKGIYCAMCNAKNGDYFNVQGLKATVSERFCRDMLTTSLPSALYLNSHFPKYINLLGLFVSSCDAKGQFKKESPPPAVVASLDNSLEKKLKDCFEQRNDAGWATACVPVCESFQIGTVAPIFQPKLELYQAVISYLNKRLGEIAAAKAADEANSALGSTGAAANGTANATNATQPAANPTTKLRMLREKYIHKHKGKSFRKERGSGRRQPRRLQTTDPAASTASSAGTANPAGAANPASAAGTNATSVNGSNAQWSSGTPSSPSNVAAAAAAKAGAAGSAAIDPMASLIYNSFNTALGLSLEGMVSTVRVYGIHYYEEGLFSQMSADKIKSLNALLKARRLKAKSKASRKLNSASIAGSLIALFMVWFVKN